MRDGAAMWRIARDSGTLDLNSSYAYLLFCRDFAGTCRIATTDGDVVGFVLAYRRPTRPDCLFVWQIAVDEHHRGRGLSTRLLEDLLVDPAGRAGPPVRTLETTITEDNAASRALFESLARRHGAALAIAPLFTAADFPDNHDGEPLITIGPFRAPSSTG
ncbi:diaminobutyrate acetyltransferase [Georgenia sp. MJ206]|uniref:diaminobutyrate acetyltransferase n=1 Tax=Georgenia wangjunii TaxID=3117730 RepID=UPI002F264A2D